MARQADAEMTGYVVTRWYRAPEVILNWMHYTQTGKTLTLCHIFVFLFIYYDYTLLILTLPEVSKKDNVFAWRCSGYLVGRLYNGGDAAGKTTV